MDLHVVDSPIVDSPIVDNPVVDRTGEITDLGSTGLNPSATDPTLVLYSH